MKGRKCWELTKFGKLCLPSVSLGDSQSILAYKGSEKSFSKETQHLTHHFPNLFEACFHFSS
jgi:hypothetical protein